MSWQITFAQSPGKRVEQQDSGGGWLSSEGKDVLALLADGAGGHQGGRMASRAAVTTAHGIWATDPPSPNEVPSFLEKISRAAHNAVANLARSEHSSRSTWLALIAGEEEAHWAHSGDSRLYHFASGKLISRTFDHSLIQALVNQGKLAPSDMATHPDRALLLQTLGGSDFYPVELASSALGDDDLFVLCTDGVWNALSDSELLSLTGCEPNQRQSRVEELVELAVKRSGERADNASLWCIART